MQPNDPSPNQRHAAARQQNMRLLCFWNPTTAAHYLTTPLSIAEPGIRVNKPVESEIRELLFNALHVTFLVLRLRETHELIVDDE
jgi:hypothetical protein